MRSKVPGPHGGRVPSAVTTWYGPGLPYQRAFHEAGAVRLLLGGQQGGAAVRGEGGEQGGLAAGARAAVQPAGVAALQRGGREGRRHELAALVLDPGPAVAHGGQRAGLAALGHPHGVRRPAAGQRALLAELLGEFVRGGAAGAGDQGDLGALVVRFQQVLDTGPAAAERVPERRDDPARVRVDDREVVLGVVLVRGGHLRHPAVEVVGGHLAQHRVDELGAPLPQHHPGQLHARGDRRVGRDTGAEELVHAHVQHVQDRRVDLAQRPVDAGGDDRVVRPLPAQRAVDQLGRQGRVPVVEVALGAGLLQQRGQDEVRVRVALVDGPQDLEGEEADRVLLGAAVRLGGTATRLVVHVKGAPLEVRGRTLQAYVPVPHRLPMRRCPLAPEQLAGDDADPARPVRGAHRLLALRLHPEQLDRVRPGAG